MLPYAISVPDLSQAAGTVVPGAEGCAVKTVNVAIIGCGNIGTRHAENLKQLSEPNVVAFVDQDLDRAAHLRQTAGTAAAVVTADARTALEDPNVDAVVIATHHDSHVPLAVAAARAGKHLFVEKPLALTNEGCREIEAAVRESGVQFVMGFQTRHAPLVRRARDWVPQPRVVFGQIIVARWDDASWAQHPETGGGNVLSQGVHGFDLLAHLPAPRRASSSPKAARSPTTPRRRRWSTPSRHHSLRQRCGRLRHHRRLRSQPLDPGRVLRSLRRHRPQRHPPPLL